MKNYNFFDPKPPKAPEAIYGVPTKAIVDLSKGVGFLNLASPRYSRGAYQFSRNAEVGVRLFPLIEKAAAGEATEQDVQRYRALIKKIPKLRALDRLAVASSVVAVGVPLRRTINKRINSEFSQRAANALSDAGAVLPKAEAYVEGLSNLDNPRQEFINEAIFLSRAIRLGAIENARARRSTEVSAIDAGRAIRQTIDEILKQNQRPPLVEILLPAELKNGVSLPNQSTFAVIAPEIISGLDLILPEEERDRGFTSSVRRHPAPKRWLAEKLKGSELRWLSDGVNLVLPSLRDILPTSGAQITETFNKIKELTAAPK